MRNTRKTLSAVILLAAAMVAGCAAKERPPRPAPGSAAQSPQALLADGYSALESQQYAEALARADQVLAAQPHGENTAGALYLKGRALEGKNAAGVGADEAQANLQMARDAYVAALRENPPQPLGGYIRTSLGNVAYFQDDYQTAVAQFSSAYEQLDRDDLKAWALYRTGLSQQRLGQFEEADKTFAAVQQRHASSIPAQRAREHQGARGYVVQLATFAQPASADKAAAALKQQGVAAARVDGPQGHAYLRVGPIASYKQAQYTRGRFLKQYPDAVIIP